MTIQEASTALRARKISSVELTKQCLARIDADNPRLNAFITVTAASALKQAEALDREFVEKGPRGPLHGIPIAHKDIVFTKGVRTTSGSKLFAGFVPDCDAEVAKKLTAAGAVMVGKTGLHELAYGITSNNPHFGAVRNPCDPERIPGGSSGGSGTALGTGMCLLATGTDTGGSIRIPASFCGIAGLKPTYGLVSRKGVQPLGFSLDHIGPMAATVRDVAIGFEAMAIEQPELPSGAPIGGWRIGLPENYYFDSCDPEVRAAVERACRKAEDLGARCVPVRVPDVAALNAVARVILMAEASAIYEKHLSRRDQFGADVLSLLDQGLLIRGTDYVQAQRLRKKQVAEFRRVFQQIDFLFTPCTPTAAPKIGQTEVEIGGKIEDVRLATTSLVRAINVLGFPALAMPCGRTSGGLPIGLQIVARPFDDSALLNLGMLLEEAIG